MLRIAVVDVSAEARSRIAREIGRLQDNASHELSLLPKLSIQQLAPEEIKFHGAPDLLIIGDELIGSDIGSVGRIRAIFSDTPIVVRLRKDQETLLIIEDLARLGADDTISENIDPLSLSKKIILHCRRPKKSRTANLIIVDSAKGGLGVTSLVAGLGEALVSSGKRVALIDLDSETQDLTRFLQSRPFINENLEMLVDGVKPVAEEHVRQCLTPVWSEEDGLYCMAPSLIGEDAQGLTPVQTRNLLSVLEIVDSIYDVVVVDIGCARGTLLKTLYRVADRVVMLVNNDPASLYATVSRMSVVRQWINPTAELVLVENSSAVSGLPSEILRREINLATKSDDSKWFNKVVPYCRSAARWPGSGDTLFSRGKKSLVSILGSLAQRMTTGEVAEADVSTERNWGIFETLRSKLNRTLPEFSRRQSSSGLQKAQKLLSFKPKEKMDSAASLEKAEAAFEKLAEAKTKAIEASEKGDLNKVDQLIRRAI
jgi:MinD-like ATPase involved in chromosome partitioning or flagellar assembly